MIYLHHIPESLRYRRSEWGLSVVILGWGLVLLNPYPTFDLPTFSVLKLWFNEIKWGYLCSVLGFARLFVLVRNGSMRNAALWRALLAALSMGVWFFITLSLLRTGIYTPGYVTYGVFFVMDLHTVKTAAREWKWKDTNGFPH